MPRTRVKICGVMTLGDALAAIAAGADAVGLVFHPAARRYVPSEAAVDILRWLPSFVTPVGLFVDASVDHVRQKAKDLSLRHIQLNGHEEPALVAALSEFRVLKSIPVDRTTFGATLREWKAAGRRMDLSNLAGIVLETAHTHQAGGSGIANDWDAVHAAQSADQSSGLPPLIAAGGLRPGNVADVIRRIRPWAVDVSSGVEETYGRKSASLLAAFMSAVRQADG